MMWSELLLDDVERSSIGANTYWMRSTNSNGMMRGSAFRMMRNKFCSMMIIGSELPLDDEKQALIGS
jgi:hypothetical protein